MEDILKDEGYVDIIIGDSRSGKVYSVGKSIPYKDYVVSEIVKDTNAYLTEGVSRFVIYVKDTKGKEYEYKEIINQPVVATKKLL